MRWKVQNGGVNSNRTASTVTAATASHNGAVSERGKGANSYR